MNVGDMAGYTYCGNCGEKHMHFVVSLDVHKYPQEVRCCGCKKTWGPWPSIKEFARRKKERQKRIQHEWYMRHRQEKIDRAIARKRRIAEERKRREEFEYEWATCPTCKREFIKDSPRQVYCRKACQVGRKRDKEPRK